MSEIVIFEDDARSVEVRLEGETLWLSLQQLAELFGRDKSVISRHLSNIFKSGELAREAVVAKNATTAADGKTYRVEYFNLDAIISVGYRVNSTRATRFRQRATRVLREHLTKGCNLTEHGSTPRILITIGRFVEPVQVATSKYFLVVLQKWWWAAQANAAGSGQGRAERAIWWRGASGSTRQGRRHGMDAEKHIATIVNFRLAFRDDDPSRRNDAKQVGPLLTGVAA